MDMAACGDVLKMTQVGEIYEFFGPLENLKIVIAMAEKLHGPDLIVDIQGKFYIEGEPPKKLDEMVRITGDLHEQDNP